MVWAYRSRTDIDTDGLVRVMNMIGMAAGLILRNDGGDGMSSGRRGRVRAMADWMSWAAASILRSRENCTVTWARPVELTEFIESMPAIDENSFSRMVATVEAMVSGLAPGREALTMIVGKSTLGRSATGSRR